MKVVQLWCMVDNVNICKICLKYYTARCWNIKKNFKTCRMGRILFKSAIISHQKTCCRPKKMSCNDDIRAEYEKKFCRQIWQNTRYKNIVFVIISCDGKVRWIDWVQFIIQSACYGYVRCPCKGLGKAVSGSFSRKPKTAMEPYLICFNVPIQRVMK